jgi:hypothetical protein
MQKAHMEELRSRDRRELVFVIVLVSSLAMYCVCALMIRGFV